MELRSCSVGDHRGQGVVATGKVWCLKLHEHWLATLLALPEVFLTLILFDADEVLDLREHAGGVPPASDGSDFDFVGCLDSDASCGSPFAVHSCRSLSRVPTLI